VQKEYVKQIRGSTCFWENLSLKYVVEKILLGELARSTSTQEAEECRFWKQVEVNGYGSLASISTL